MNELEYDKNNLKFWARNFEKQKNESDWKKKNFFFPESDSSRRSSFNSFKNSYFKNSQKYNIYPLKSTFWGSELPKISRCARYIFQHLLVRS